jgi:hypothetical protein
MAMRHRPVMMLSRTSNQNGFPRGHFGVVGQGLNPNAQKKDIHLLSTHPKIEH